MKTKEQVLSDLQSNDKYKEWGNLEEYAKENGFTFNYINRYRIELVLIPKKSAVMINCENCYGCSMIESFGRNY